MPAYLKSEEKSLSFAPVRTAAGVDGSSGRRESSLRPSVAFTNPADVSRPERDASRFR